MNKDTYYDTVVRMNRIKKKNKNNAWVCGYYYYTFIFSFYTSKKASKQVSILYYTLLYAYNNDVTAILKEKKRYIQQNQGTHKSIFIMIYITICI